MERYGLIGHPVGHSHSPAMQEAGFQALGIDARYELIDAEPTKLADVFQSMRKTHRGWNVTIPHKEAAVGLVDEIDDVARKLGSVNTVVNDGGRLKGFSTDGYGLEVALKEAFGFGFDGKRVCFLGTGNNQLQKYVSDGCRDLLLRPLIPRLSELGDRWALC